MPLVFPFDPRIERAATIPARLYNDPVYLELERERVFAHTWQLVGANLDGKAPPLGEVLEDVPARVAPFRCEAMRYVTRKQWDIACNWKVYVDNYLEGYHLPVVHPGLHKELDYDQYRVEPHRYYSLQHAPLRAVHGGNPDRRYDPSKTDVAEAVYVWLFPNVML